MREFILRQLARPPRARLGVSLVGTDCVREAYYAAIGAPQEDGERGLLKMALGSALDAYALPSQTYLGQQHDAFSAENENLSTPNVGDRYVVAHSQVRVEAHIGRAFVPGHADLVIYHVWSTGDWFEMAPVAVWDLKTVGMGSWRAGDDGAEKWRPGTWEKVQKAPSDKHRSQVNVYAAALGLGRFGICYVNANTGEILEHICQTSEADAWSDLGLLEEAERHVRMGQPPPREYRDREEDDGTISVARDSWPCQWCRYRAICWEEELAREQQSESI